MDVCFSSFECLKRRVRLACVVVGWMFASAAFECLKRRMCFACVVVGWMFALAALSASSAECVLPVLWWGGCLLEQLSSASSAECVLPVLWWDGCLLKQLWVPQAQNVFCLCCGGVDIYFSSFECLKRRVCLACIVVGWMFAYG